MIPYTCPKCYESYLIREHRPEGAPRERCPYCENFRLCAIIQKALDYMDENETAIDWELHQFNDEQICRESNELRAILEGKVKE